ncbi:glycosyl transferase family 2 [Bacteroidia bacterium]|nr:glycosyl transferase family 2 [Bacteroidia bacterium]
MDQLPAFTPLELILLSVTAVFFVVQLLYYTVTYFRPCRRVKQLESLPGLSEQPPVSIIVYAKNESQNLGKHLPMLLKQNYGEYEVIVINDGSTDESDEVLAKYESEYSHLYHTFIPQESRYLSRRKLSLTLGIKAAKYDILFFIEANCRPLSYEWLANMVRNYDEKAMIVLGYCAYTEHKGFFHKLVGYDNLLEGLQYISASLIDRPYSGNGRNLSYRKKLFFEHKGYSHSLSLHAGDDDLFINESATRENTRVEYAIDSITEMTPIDYFSVWKEMKVSRAATQRHYQGTRLLFYRAETLSLILFLLGAVASVVVGCIFNNLLIIGIAVLLYLILYVVKVVVLSKSAAMLRQKLSAALLPLLEISRVSIDIYVLIYRAFRGKKDYTFTFGGK